MNELSLTGEFNELFLTSSIDYICTSLLQHYYLYTASLCHEREQQLHNCNLKVEISPISLMPLSKGIPFHVWEMDEKIKEQDQEMHQQEEVRNEYLARQTKLLATSASRLLYRVPEGT